MLSSTTMTDANVHRPPIALSEEVQDILHDARKLAQKRDKGLLQDHHLLYCMLRQNRLFTRQDALLKKAGASPKLLNKLYREERARLTAESSQPESSVIATAQAIAASHSNGDAQNRVEIEHLLMALLSSPDSVVKAVINKSQLTPEKLKAAIPLVSEGSLLRFMLYCLREVLEVVVIVVVLVILIKQGVGELRLIPSESMVPTLQVGDRIVVEKVSHWTRPVQRGDILVFYPPEPESVLPGDPWSVFLRLTGFSGIIYDKESLIDRAYIKRVVGLPGDTVNVQPGDGVYINGKRITEPYISEIANTCTLFTYCGPLKVPANSYYLMGDNRNNSTDSRAWQFLPQERIIGRAVFRFFPLDNRLGPLETPTYAPR